MADVNELFDNSEIKKDGNKNVKKVNSIKKKIHNQLLDTTKPKSFPIIETGTKIDEIVRLQITNRLVIGGLTNTGKSVLASYIAYKSMDAFKKYYEEEGRLDEMKDRLKVYVIDTEVGQIQSPMYEKYPDLYDFDFKVRRLKDLRSYVETGKMDVIADNYSVIIIDSLSKLLNSPEYSWLEKVDDKTGETYINIGEGLPFIKRKRDLLPLINWLGDYQAKVMHGEKEPLLVIMVAHLTKAMRPDLIEPEKLIYGQFTFGSALHEEIMYMSDNILILGVVNDNYKNKNYKGQMSFSGGKYIRVEVGTWKTRGIMRGNKKIIKITKDGEITD